MMAGHDLAQWCAHLRAIAEPAAADVALGGAGALADPFRIAVCGNAAAAGAPPTGAVAGEIALWWALAGRPTDVDRVIGEPMGGSLLPVDGYSAIEVWTEAELSGLHALWRLAREHDRLDWMRRAEAVRNHHLVHTQPDNATNRPWALHVFLLGGTPESTHYAETLLHNAMALTGAPDPFSAWILLDAAAELERADPARDA